MIESAVKGIIQHGQETEAPNAGARLHPLAAPHGRTSQLSLCASGVLQPRRESTAASNCKPGFKESTQRGRKTPSSSESHNTVAIVSQTSSDPTDDGARSCLAHFSRRLNSGLGRAEKGPENVSDSQSNGLEEQTPTFTTQEAPSRVHRISNFDTTTSRGGPNSATTKMATPWRGKGMIHEYQFFDCATHGTTRWDPWGDGGQDRPASELHEHLRSIFVAGRNDQITWHKGTPPGFKRFQPPQHCQMQTHPLEELYPNEDSTPLKIGHAIVCLHVDNGVTTSPVEDQQAGEQLASDAEGENKEPAAQGKDIGAKPLPATSSTSVMPTSEPTQPLGSASRHDSEEMKSAEPKARAGKGKGKGRAVEQERGVEGAQAAPAAHMASSAVSSPTQAAGIDTSGTGHNWTPQGGHSAAVVAGPSSRPGAKPANLQVAWTSNMKLCLWVMEQASNPRLSGWKQRADVWNEVFKGDKIFKGNDSVLSRTNAVAVHKLRVQYTEREKANQKEDSLPPALQQWKEITEMDQAGQKFLDMQQKVQVAINTLNAENRWTA
ncbi:hypothetical protein CERZMDRAFT_81175 [Cercospora zeae-maydis SCOH1-5]|uniref:Uncharacterized protein n=1 Tax=Cercospora zeae-maydis SCOH1-5 TaxID=717836 RepID=A0A6A6FUP9_9PEZI|nr:hypothetical protein CERZMDRAFT_81175 [Cercospora zeae-maydis SCOH1-5]